MASECAGQFTSIRELVAKDVSTLDRVLTTRLAASDHALGLQLRETERRLAELNNHAQTSLLQRQEDRERFLPREVYHETMKELTTWRERVNTRLDAGMGQGAGISMAWVVIIQAVAVIVALAAFWNSLRP